jgi:hypothetical protein
MNIVEHFKRWDIQISGAILLAGGYVFLLLHHTFFMCSFLAMAGMVDLYLIYVAKDKTISHYCRSMVGYKKNTILWLVLMAVILIIRGWDVCGITTIGLLINHITLNDDEEIVPKKQ